MDFNCFCFRDPDIFAALVNERLVGNVVEEYRESRWENGGFKTFSSIACLKFLKWIYFSGHNSCTVVSGLVDCGKGEISSSNKIFSIIAVYCVKVSLKKFFSYIYYSYFYRSSRRRTNSPAHEGGLDARRGAPADGAQAPRPGRGQIQLASIETIYHLEASPVQLCLFYLRLLSITKE